MVKNTEVIFARCETYQARIATVKGNFLGPHRTQLLVESHDFKVSRLVAEQQGVVAKLADNLIGNVVTQDNIFRYLNLLSADSSANKQ